MAVLDDLVRTFLHISTTLIGLVPSLSFQLFLHKVPDQFHHEDKEV